MPLLGLLADKHLDAIDNPRLVRLKQKTLGWMFTTIYIPGKLLGGTDALSSYSLRHCTEEEVLATVHDSSLSDRQHLIGFLATVSLPPDICQPRTQANPLLLDIDTHLINSMSTEVRSITWNETKVISSSAPSVQSLTKVTPSSFPPNKGDLPPLG